MRINVYHHEIQFMATRAVWLTKTADTGDNFYGLRLPTEPELMHQPGDDDSAAVTLWVPWTRRGGHDTRELRAIAENMIRFCDWVDEHETEEERHLANLNRT